MDAIEDEREGRAATRRRACDERVRAASYLDLWERHVALTAVNGVTPWTSAAACAPRRAGA